MKKLLMTVAAVALLATPAIADDLTEKMLTEMTACENSVVVPGSDEYEYCFRLHNLMTKQFGSVEAYEAEMKKHNNMLLNLFNAIPKDKLTSEGAIQIMTSVRLGV